MSTGGLFIRTERPFNPGTQFLLKLQLPGVSDQLDIKCEVAWARKEKGIGANQPPGMGVKFPEISKRNHQILRQFLATFESR